VRQSKLIVSDTDRLAGIAIDLDATDWHIKLKCQLAGYLITL
jgi:hypothetical protein